MPKHQAFHARQAVATVRPPVGDRAAVGGTISSIDRPTAVPRGNFVRRVGDRRIPTRSRARRPRGKTGPDARGSVNFGARRRDAQRAGDRGSAALADPSVPVAPARSRRSPARLPVDPRSRLDPARANRRTHPLQPRPLRWGSVDHRWAQSTTRISPSSSTMTPPSGSHRAAPSGPLRSAALLRASASVAVGAIAVTWTTPVNAGLPVPGSSR